MLCQAENFHNTLKLNFNVNYPQIIAPKCVKNPEIYFYYCYWPIKYSECYF